MEKNPYTFWEWVQSRMDELDIPSFRRLEIRAGVSNGLISGRKNDMKLPTVDMAIGLCRALRVTWVELWSHAGVIPRRPDDEYPYRDLYFEALENLWDMTPDWKKRDLVVGLRAFIEDRGIYDTEREVELAEGDGAP